VHDSENATMNDVLLVGAGPAGMALAAALGKLGVRVTGLAPSEPSTPWINTYGIWADELDGLALPDVLGLRWTDCSAYMHGPEIKLARTYALFANEKLQSYLLAQCEESGIIWRQGLAARVEHFTNHSIVTTADGTEISARLVVDASGHSPALVRRPHGKAVAPQAAYQAAYGLVGTFSAPPVRAGQLVLMDYRSGHLDPGERKTQPPTFLYAMDLGDGQFFVEETSLAHAPAVSFAVLKDRLHRRLVHRGITVTEIHHVEHCLFPMNLPLPDLRQPVLGYGGAASMVHPASGYQVGAALKGATPLATTLATILDGGTVSPVQAALAGWQVLWPNEAIRNRNLYLFGLECIMHLDEAQLHDFFTAFFALPHAQWTGYLSNTLSTAELSHTMLHLFGDVSNRVRLALLRTAGRAPDLLWHALLGRP
jgi:lycopene beta-cyclase